jgi:uncharacterized protein (TIGR02246 family)
MTIADVDAVAKAFHEGVASQDAEALASLYHEDARFMPPGMPTCEGRPAIQAAMQMLLDAGARSLDVEPVEIRQAGPMTIEYGLYTLVVEPEDLPPMTDTGKYLVVHEARPDGSNRVLFDIFNSNSAPG